MFRADAPELMAGDAVEDDVERLRDRTRALAELLADLLPRDARRLEDGDGGLTGP